MKAIPDRLVARRLVALYGGILAVMAGVASHASTLLDAFKSGGPIRGMEMGPETYAGMALIVAGLVSVAYGLLPPRPSAPAPPIRVTGLDDARMTARHLALIVAVVVALIVDVMKPASLGFVVPGMAREYGISRAVVAWLPFWALTGTTIGSFLWGWAADRLGRRSTLLMAAAIFVGTSICGAMPLFGWNLAMCFLMGLAAGGMLPIAVSLLSEFMPARFRGPLLVMVAALGTVGGYLAASAAAALLEPEFGWRILWFLNFPTGLLVILLNPLIPESPRFLVQHGRTAESARILEQFKARVIAAAELPAPGELLMSGRGIRSLLRAPLLRQTVAVTAYSLSWGIVNFGFLLWLPTNLRAAGFSSRQADVLIGASAVIALPGALVVMLLYGWWSSRRSLVLTAGATAAALIGLSFLPKAGVGSSALLVALVGAVLVSSSAMTSLLSPYCTEVFPTAVRATGSGVAAGTGKLGGLVSQAASIAHLAPALAPAGLIAAVPVVAAAILIAFLGLETRGKALDEVAAPA